MTPFARFLGFRGSGFMSWRLNFVYFAALIGLYNLDPDDAHGNVMLRRLLNALVAMCLFLAVFGCFMLLLHMLLNFPASGAGVGAAGLILWLWWLWSWGCIFCYGYNGLASIFHSLTPLPLQGATALATTPLIAMAYYVFPLYPNGWASRRYRAALVAKAQAAAALRAAQEAALPVSVEHDAPGAAGGQP